MEASATDVTLASMQYEPQQPSQPLDPQLTAPSGYHFVLVQCKDAGKSFLGTSRSFVKICQTAQKNHRPDLYWEWAITHLFGPKPVTDYPRLVSHLTDGLRLTREPRIVQFRVRDLTRPSHVNIEATYTVALAPDLDLNDHWPEDFTP